jgi:uncharacterized protein (DUF2249 family)
MTMARKFKTLDVRPLLAKGVEPFPAIRARVDQLRPGEGLSVIAPFLPSPLIEKLASERFCIRVEHHLGYWITHFWRDEGSGGE